MGINLLFFVTFHIQILKLCKIIKEKGYYRPFNALIKVNWYDFVLRLKSTALLQGWDGC